MRNSLSACPSGDNCKLRLVRDTRVKAFSFNEAVAFLKEQNHLFYPLTWDAWAWMCHQPNTELVQAYDDYFLPTAYETENKYSELLEEVK